jgi:hypothetical protein
MGRDYKMKKHDIIFLCIIVGSLMILANFVDFYSLRKPEQPKIYNCTGSTRQEHFNEFLKICLTRSNGEYCVPAGKELYCNDEVWK